MKELVSSEGIKLEFAHSGRGQGNLMGVGPEDVKSGNVLLVLATPEGS